MNIYQGKLTHTYDYFRIYVQYPIDSQYVFGNIQGKFPDVFRGGKEGEVYVTSWFPNESYKASFSADTGEHFRVVYHSQPDEIVNKLQFMSDRKAGDFYILRSNQIPTNEPYGIYYRICIEHYTDYGAVLAGRYCHDLTKDGIVTGIEEAERIDEPIVYPNPTNGQFKVQSSRFKVQKIQLFDIFGKQVLETNETTFDIERLAAGIYIARIETEQGVVTKKIIKQ